MQSEVMFAGFGGQGILMIGKILAHAAMEEGYEVVWIPSYGPEMRGGTAYCTVVISDRPIGSPIIKNPMHLIAMNRPSLEKFAPTVKPNGVILVNSSLIPIRSNRTDVDELIVPATDIAKELGSIKAANIVALSAFVSRSKVVDFERLRECVKAEFAGKSKFIPLNMEAMDRGRAAASR
ncbi:MULTISPECIES: 2-oxoacid:acceptor oxidoreductase family protein [Desulfococcus]|uniref:Pyruvate/ketoisovalerate oxidoreductase, gamma subunit n=1 Tax=Desulfococcus multivorans DSM 2059 TaxID=1121405 RepID=S7U101_DESML|nr:2-oxoacid:acceptor oxidoreductase family protein [Desulfococcus multivorans]AOY59289.1 KorC3: 2-oxoglutarate synthase, subunit gamma [Desulfococcus multivorans]AQV01511.1 2-oxoacid:ferredoxin oxidoreductase subunit gamma [Desulfococcus multivorans]EPR43017.1 pyruvate/ketoisovalerate oxidoreductase, gamma subunit [Desulfococcus multivorans DSM 2059]MDX9819652.1 2-oxoacid:acceptor oxidoreductase family protein [Desulfococcus multivorans]SKA14871.1 2-oxoglutarate ferredoxin oxidoreductase subu